MSTDFNKDLILTNGAFKTSKRNTPLDIRIRIEDLSEIPNIPLPYVGMIFYVINENEFYRVLTLKSKLVGGRPQEDITIGTYEKLVNLEGLATEEWVENKLSYIESTPGAQGPIGPKGEQGDKGIQGPKGELGPQGPSGKDGVAGANGKSAFEIAVKSGFSGTEEEWLVTLKGVDGAKGEKGDRGEQGPVGLKGDQGPIGPKGVDGTFNINAIYEALETENKDVIGAINELLAYIKQLTPNTPLGTKMFYGYLPYEFTGTIDNFNQVAYDMLTKAGETVKAATPSRVGKVSAGDVTEGSLVFVAIPTAYKFEVTKDNGIGGEVPFNTSVLGSNGVPVVWNGTPYTIYGELMLTSGEIFVYID